MSDNDARLMTVVRSFLSPFSNVDWSVVQATILHGSAEEREGSDITVVQSQRGMLAQLRTEKIRGQVMPMRVMHSAGPARAGGEKKA